MWISAREDRKFVAALLAWCVLLTWLTWPAFGAEKAPHPDHGPEHFYATWMQPDHPDTSCCDMKDCAPAQAKFENGAWFARWKDDEEWALIPPHKVERDRDVPDGRAHLCGYRDLNKKLVVYCFGAGAGG